MSRQISYVIGSGYVRRVASVASEKWGNQIAFVDEAEGKSASVKAASLMLGIFLTKPG